MEPYVPSIPPNALPRESHSAPRGILNLTVKPSFHLTTFQRRLSISFTLNWLLLQLCQPLPGGLSYLSVAVLLRKLVVFDGILSVAGLPVTMRDVV